MPEAGPPPRDADATALAARVGARAIDLIEDHLRLLAAGDLAAARRQLFWPPTVTQKPVEIYLATMQEIAPFALHQITVARVEPPRAGRHGVVASVWVSVDVACGLGRRATYFIVWWFPDGDRLLISARPSEWVIERRKAIAPG